QARRHNHKGQADDGHQRETEKVETAAVHRPLRKKRPVMPCGSSRIKTIAAASSATSPNTGVVTKVATWLIVPNKAEAETVPLRMAAPPPISMMPSGAEMPTVVLPKIAVVSPTRNRLRPHVASIVSIMRP